MFARIANSWELVKASANVLRSDKELLMFPIISMIGAVIVTATFAVPMLLADLTSEALYIIVGFIFYVVMYTVIIFSNSALVGAAMIRLNGGDPTLSDGFRIARQHIGQIIGYAVISATVGMILRAISERGGIIGQIVSSLLGMAWNIITFLVIPVLVIEDLGPLEAVKRSGSLLKETWGEQIVGNFSIGIIFGLIGLAIVAVGVPLVIVAAATESLLLIVMVIALLVLALVALGLINSALSGIYTAAVYQYAVDGRTGDFFPEDMVQGAFRLK